MKKLFEIKIKSRFTGDTLFKAECESMKVCLEMAVRSGANLDGASLVGANLYGASLIGASLVRANLVRANLDGTSLIGASLDGANLYGASLVGASLYGASLVGASLVGASLVGADGKRTTIEKHPLQIYGLRWPIIIFDKDMYIGCEYHSISDWFGFDDARIKEMDSNALDFWQKNKIAIKAICDANGRH